MATFNRQLSQQTGKSNHLKSLGQENRVRFAMNGIELTTLVVIGHMAKSGRFAHLHTSPFLMASMRLSISMAIFQKLAILEIIEFLVNL